MTAKAFENNIAGSSSRLPFNIDFLRGRVPDTFQLGAILPFPAFGASRKINKLRVFNTPEYSDSPRLHQFKATVINNLQRFRCIRVPDEFHWRFGTGGGECVQPPLLRLPTLLACCFERILRMHLIYDWAGTPYRALTRA